MSQCEATDVLQQFPITVSAISPLDTSGFSGANVWKITSAEGDGYCLKGYPSGNLTADHLQWIHRVLAHTAINGCNFVALPIKASQSQNGQQRFVSHRGCLWELSPWAAGVQSSDGQIRIGPNETRWSDAKLQNAFTSIARFHQAAAQVNFDFRPSPNISTRLERLAAYRQTLDKAGQSTMPTATTKSVQRELDQLRLATASVSQANIDALLNKLRPFANQTLPIQPVVRDLRAEHLFFDGDQLSGLIDFDAMQMDSIAYDLSRLSSTMGLDDRQIQTALESYSSVRPIQPIEEALIPLLSAASRLLVPLQWIQWLLVEQREFSNTQMVKQRITAATENIAKG